MCRFMVRLAFHHGVTHGLVDVIYMGLPRNIARVKTTRLFALLDVIACFASRSLSLIEGPGCALLLPSRSLHCWIFWIVQWKWVCCRSCSTLTRQTWLRFTLRAGCSTGWMEPERISSTLQVVIEKISFSFIFTSSLPSTGPLPAQPCHEGHLHQLAQPTLAGGGISG